MLENPTAGSLPRYGEDVGILFDVMNSDKDIYMALKPAITARMGGNNPEAGTDYTVVNHRAAYSSEGIPNALLDNVVYYARTTRFAESDSVNRPSPGCALAYSAYALAH